MCDCFHMVLPTWPGAPGSVSGRQLQPEEPDAETEEDPSVTEGPVDEIIRPRPQGSSPVYEYTPEGASFRFPEDTPSRQGSSGRRRSWWKRDSGDSRTISRMSHSEEVTEVVLNTEVEAGASGYSVTGGGDQGIFVKQVLKDSSAAKLFSLREGDQLLSATIFFDNINYEDALKILQYSEPYKVQFKVKRKLSAQGDEVWASSAAQHALTRAGKQDKDVANGSTDTPMKTLERDGDQERLISKPREGRGRRPQKDRLSWPKFQAIKSRRGPRRSHSSSEAYEKGKAPDVSPTSSDTEAQFPAGASSRRRRRCPNLRFKMEQAEGRYGEEGKGLRHRPKITVDRENGRKTEGDISLGDKEVAARDSKFKMPKFKMPSFGASVPSKSIEASVDVSLPKVEADVSLPSVQADVKTRDLRIELPSADVDIKPGKLGVKLPEGHVPEGEPQGLTAGAGFKGHLPKVQMPSLKMPKVDLKGPQVDVKGPKLNQRGTKREVTTTDGKASLPGVEVDIQAPRAKLEGDTGLGDKEMTARDSKFKMPKFKMPSFGVSAPDKDWGTSVDVPKATGEAILPSLGGEVRAPEGSVQLTSAEIEVPGGELEVALPEGEVTLGELKGKAEGAGFKGRLPKVQMPSIKMPKVDIKGPQVDLKGPKLDLTGAKGEMSTRDVQLSLPSVEVDLQAPHDTLEGDIGLGDKEVAARDSKFKMPKFKMPSFGTLAPSKSIEASVDVSLPKVEADVSVPSVQADVMAPDLSIKLPSADVDIMTGELSLELLEGQMPEGELQGPTAGAGLKGHLPKVPMPSVKMPKVDLKGPQVDFKGPQVDIKGPKMDLRGVKGKVTTPDVEASLPGVEVDIQTPGTKLEGDIGLGDKEVAARDSKFKMPKFKMPSFGMSAPGKDWGTSVDGPGGEVRAPEGSVQLTSAEIEVPGGELEVALPEGEVTLGELKGKAEGAGFKGRLPKVQMPSIKMPKVDIKGPQVDIKGPKVDLKGPQVDIKGHQLDLSGATGKVTALEVEASLPGVEVDIQAPGDTLEGDISLGDKEVAARDSKFKMPKFKMPSFGTSAPSKSIEASVDVSLPKVEADVSVPSVQADVKAPDLSIKLPSADVDIMTGELGLKLPEGEMPEGQLQGPTTGAGLKGQLPKVQMPSLKMPKVDLKGSQVDFKGPKMDLRGAKGKVTVPDVEVLLPGVEVDIQAPGAKLEGDIGMGDKEVAARDSKFKMPKFKMPSFGVSAPSKGWGTSVDVPMPKATGEATLPSLGGEVRAPEGSVQLTSAEIEVPGGELEVALPEGEVSLGELKGKAEGSGFKGRLPKVQMPSIKMPKVDIKGPQVDIKGPKVDLKGPQVDIKGHQLDLSGATGKVTALEVEALLPGVEVDIQAPGDTVEGDIGLGDKEMAARDSKFKMPKFKMPSFGTSGPSKSSEASVDVSLPKVEADVSVPSVQADIKARDLSIELPSADVGITTGELSLELPEGQMPKGERQVPTAGAGLKGHLPKVPMPSVKMPKVDLKGPQVDIKGPKMDLRGVKGKVTVPDVEALLPGVEVDIQAPGAKLEGDISLGDKEVAARDSKFKMPKFKMPSFGMSAPGKDWGTSVDVPMPKATGEATLPSLGGEVRAPEGSVQLTSAEIEVPGGELEVALPEGEVTLGELKGKAEGVGFKGHLPKVQMPSIKMPKVDIKGPQVDIKGPKVDLKGPEVDIKGHKLDLRGNMGEVTSPDMEASLTGVEMDLQAGGVKLEGDISLGDKELATRESNLKMPQFKMPSFGVSAPDKDWGTSVDGPGGEVQAPEGSVQLASAEIKLPGGELKGKTEGAGFKGRLPKVQMPSIKMPKVDIKDPQVDIKSPKLDLKGAKEEMSTPDVQVTLPSMKLDQQAPDATLEGDISLGDKEVAARDSKFKMPQFKMPSFGVSIPSKSIDASVDVTRPKVEADVALPSFEADVKTCDLSIELPSADVDIKTRELDVNFPEGNVPEEQLQGPTTGAGLKGHLPKVQMPSLRMPKVDLKGPQVDIKGQKLDLSGTTGEVTAPNVEALLSGVEVDIQTPGTKLEGDIGLGDKEVAARDSKFKMPKFKMPSFGVSAPGKDWGTSVDVPMPKATGEATLPSLGGEMRAPEGSVQLTSAEIEVPGGELEVALPEGEVTLGELKGKAEGAGFKGRLPKVQMPSIKMPKVDIKGPQVDLKGPKLDLMGAKGEMSTPDVQVSLPSVKLDHQAPDAALEGDIGLGDKEVAARDSKFKMPKFKMPSFGTSTPSKSIEVSVDVSLPKGKVDVSLPPVHSDVKAPDLSIELPSADVDITTGELGLKLPEGHLPEGELHGPTSRAGLKGHLPKVQMPSLKMPQVDLKSPQVEFKGPQVDIKGHKLDLRVATGEVTAPDVEASLPAVEVDRQTSGTSLEGDIDLGEKEVASRESKFKTPKFKMPSFGASTPSKSIKASVDVSLPKFETDVSLPSVPADVKAPDLSIELPSADRDVKTGELNMKLAEGHLPEGQLQGPTAGAGLKGQLPKVQMPSLKMPKIDLKGPQVDIKGPKLDLRDTKGKVTTPDVEASLPGVEMDIQALGAKLEGDIGLGDKEVAARESKIKMPKFKMPSMSAQGRDWGTSVDMPMPKATGEATLPSLGGEVRAPEGSVQLTSAEIEVPGGELEVALPEGEVTLGELKGKAEGAGFKGRLPKVQMPSIKMPKVDIKGPQVDIKGPKLDLKGAKGEMSTPDMQLSLPSVELDHQALDAALEGDISLGDKEVAARDSKFKMPQFKMPSFGASIPSKSIEASVDMSLPKVKADVALPPVEADVKTHDLSIKLPSADVDIKTRELGVKLPEGHVPEEQLQGPTTGAGLKGHLPKVQMPSLRMPKVDLKGPQVDIKGQKLDLSGTTGEVTAPNVEASLSGVEVDIQTPGTKLEGDIGLGDKEVAARDSKFKMPKFKMPSFGVSAPGKDWGTSVDVPMPKATGEATLPSLGGEVRAPEGSVQLTSAEIEVPGGELEVALPEGEVTLGELKGKAEGVGFKGRLPKVQMPSIKMPKVDIKGPQVDLKGPKLDLMGAKGEMSTPDVQVSLPSVKLDHQAPDATLEGDVSLGDKEVAARDSKFKMPQFKMPSLGTSVPSKSMEVSVDVSLSKVKADISMPSVQADVKTHDLSTELPSADVDIHTGELGVKLSEHHLPKGELQGPTSGAGLKGHLPKVQMPSLKMPKIDLKGAHVDIKGPKLDLRGAKGEVTAPDVEASLPGMMVDLQAPGANQEGDIGLGEKELTAGDSKFKMPKFKMPSFGVSAPSKSIKASVDVSLPKVEVDVSPPSVPVDVEASDLSIELPSADVDVKTGELNMKLLEGHLPEGQLQGPTTGAGLKGQLPKVQMPSLKMPKIDLKGPQVDIKGPKLDVRGAKGEVTAAEVEVSLPGLEVDIQAQGAKLEGDIGMGGKEVVARDSKFKMPQFKMPSFDKSVPSMSTDASVDMSLPKVEVDVSLPSVEADVKTRDLSIKLPSADVDVKRGELGVKLLEGYVPEEELQGPTAGAGLKGHLPKVQMPSLKMPKVDLKGAQVDIKGPKMDLRGAKGKVIVPDVEALLPGVEVDIQAPGAKLEGDISLGDKEVAARDSKFKMPKFKMPSFGTSAPGKDWGTSVDVPMPKATGEATLPDLGGDVRAPEGSVQLTSAEIEVPGGELEVALPEGEVSLGELKGKAEGAGFKGHLPKVQMPSIKMPKVDIKGPQVDIKRPKVDLKGPQVAIKGPQLDLRGAKGKVTTTDVEASLPSIEVDLQAPGANLQSDIGLDEKEVATRDSKFKMPKFKMPSFGASAPSKSIEASVDVSLTKGEVDISLPSVKADVKTSDLSIELPSADMDVKPGRLGVKLPEGHIPEGELQGSIAGLKGSLPKVQMPSLKMPKVDLKGPQVDIKGPQLDLTGAKGEVTTTDVEALLPSVQVDIQVPGAKMEGDIGLGDKEMAARDSKFKMPKFKMPSFGMSAPDKDWGTSVDVPMPKATGEATLPSLGGEVRAPEGSVQLTSAEIEVPGGELEVALPEGEVTLGELKGKAEGAGFKGRLPKVQMPSIKMPKVDIKGPQVDIKGPKLDLKGAKGEMSTPDVQVSLPSVKLDHQAPDAALEGDIGLGDKELAARDSKFKMPKFKMPSFGASAPSKSIKASVDVSLPKGKVDVSLSSVPADAKAPDLSIELPSADVGITTRELGVKLPEGHRPEEHLQGPTAGAGLKGHLPKVQMPSLKMPKVDLKGAQVDIKGPKLDLRGAKGEVTTPDMEVLLPGVEVDIQAQGAKLEGDIGMGDKEVAARDSKFKMPKFKMPSFSASGPSKSIDASMDVSLPKVEADIKTSKLRTELPSVNVDVQTGELGVKLLEGHLHEGELYGPTTGAGLKGHLPKVQMPSLKMPKVDLKGPQVDIKGPKMDLRGIKGEVTTPHVEASLPGVEVDIQALDAKLAGDIGLGDKEVAARDRKFKMPKFKMPSFGISAPGKDWGTSVDVSVPKATGEATLLSLGGDVRAPEGSVQLTSAEIEVPGGELEVALPEGEVTLGELKGKAEGAGFKGRLPKVQMPSIKMPKVDLKGPKLDLRVAKSEFSAPGVEASLPGVQVDLQAADATLEGDFDVEFSDGTVSGSRFQMPCTRTSSHTQPSVPSTRFDGSGYHAEASCEGVTLTKYQVTLPRATVPPELPQETPFEGKGDAPLFSPQCTEDLPSSERVPLSQIDGHPVPVDPLIRTSYGQLTFPKFHLPKFSISASEAAEAVGETCAAGGALSPPSPEGSLDSKEAPVFPSGAQLPSGSVPTSKGMEDPVGRVRTSAVAPDGGPAEDTDHDGKGSPLKLPRLRLPSFRRSPKKGAELQGDPGLSLVVDSGAPGVHVPQVEAHVDVTTEKDGGKGRVKMPGFAMPKLALPKLKASKGGVGLPPGDTEPAFSGSSVAVTSLATVGASGKGVAGGTGTTSGAPGEDTNLHLSQVPLSSAGFAKPDLGPIQAQAEASQSMGDLPLGDGSKGHGLGDGSASQWHGEVVASSTEDPLQATCRAPDPAAPTAGSPEGDSAGRGVPASSQDSWFRMPSLRLPSFWRSSKERGGDVGLGAQVQVPVSSAPGEGEVPATVRSCAPVSEVAAALPLPPPEAEADVAEVLRPSLDSKGLKLHLPPTGMSPHDLSTSEARPGPGEGSLPLQTPGGRLSETRAPPEEPGQTPAGSAERTEPWSSPLEGPLTLKASQTEELAQISVIDMGQLWQDSVLTVRFPTLKVPRFTFPAPSSEADVFIPATREVWCPDSSIDLALYKESPGVWGTSILKAGAGVPWERPVALDISDAPPISKVRVHIQGAQVETQEVTIHSRVTTEFADVSGRETVSTQIVRESEIPASEIQTPSYGFSLLKGKVAEGPLRAQVHMVTQDSQLQEGLQVSSKHVAPVPGDLQPDTGEPFEIITPSVHVPGPQTTFEVRPGSQFADSCSDEEPAEILEFPPEDSRGEGSATEDKPESKRSSGRFRFWLPSIGFASSAEDASADSTGDTQTPAPIRTQPEALPTAELPKKPEKAGWFRFPKLGFSSLPSKKSESPGDPACLTESKPQEEAVTFFDAQESFYTEEQEEGEPAEAASARPGPSATATSSVTRGLGRPEQGRHTSAEPAPRPATK